MKCETADCEGLAQPTTIYCPACLSKGGAQDPERRLTATEILAQRGRANVYWAQDRSERQASDRMSDALYHAISDYLRARGIDPIPERCWPPEARAFRARIIEFANEATRATSESCPGEGEKP